MSQSVQLHYFSVGRTHVLVEDSGLLFIQPKLLLKFRKFRFGCLTLFKCYLPNQLRESADVGFLIDFVFRFIDTFYLKIF